MKYKLKLRDDNLKIHPVTVTIPGEENEPAAIQAGIEHLSHLGIPFREFSAEDDLMEIEITDQPSVFSKERKLLPENYVGPPLKPVPMTESTEWNEASEKTMADWPAELPPQNPEDRDEDETAPIVTKAPRNRKGKV